MCLYFVFAYNIFVFNIPGKYYCTENTDKKKILYQ